MPNLPTCHFCSSLNQHCTWLTNTAHESLIGINEETFEGTLEALPQSWHLWFFFQGSVRMQVNASAITHGNNDWLNRVFFISAYTCALDAVIIAVEQELQEYMNSGVRWTDLDGNGTKQTHYTNETSHLMQTLGQCPRDRYLSIAEGQLVVLSRASKSWNWSAMFW